MYGILDMVWRFVHPADCLPSLIYFIEYILKIKRHQKAQANTLIYLSTICDASSHQLLTGTRVEEHHKSGRGYYKVVRQMINDIEDRLTPNPVAQSVIGCHSG
jgi:hypothetical protein